MIYASTLMMKWKAKFMGRESPDRGSRLTSMRISELSGGCQGEHSLRRPLGIGNFVNSGTKWIDFTLMRLNNRICYASLASSESLPRDLVPL